MTILARDIDHLSLTLGDPEATAAHLQRLGFTSTPEGVEPRCICFQPQRDDVPSYIELLQGDPPAIAVALNVAELAGEDRAHRWETDDGLAIDAIVTVGKAEGPLPWFAVHHETPDAFMEPEWVVHPNGALGLVAIHAVAGDPKALARTLERAWGAAIEEIFDSCLLVKTGMVELMIWSAAAYQLEYRAIEVMAPQELPAIVGLTVAVERTRPLQALLRANNVAFSLGDGNRVLTASAAAGGLMIEFMPQN
ncbi:MAG: VOC family protein [Alphaproteobacteria bacterium]|nr:VOC family protein [Alphaproteobacteria bacterium]